ncbi:GNAT family N-acetyltransferase [Paludibaculum fermentans]|uniref:N-acetyltransferase n=1 Tax=Paludibaculum fermentans TaxID=1473598 RepID=A0A7S7NKI0_PALFE|nr:N-acetyltransferase [Paludibaculum fermentans]QOY85307.1 N-acetyltransferase [Paludibaculum fermentans]
MISLREWAPDDQPATRGLLIRAFGRPGEADLVEALRAEGAVILELVAEMGQQVAGHIVYSRLSLDPARESLQMAALAPLAVDPEFQRRGIGGALIHMSLPTLAHAGVDAVVVLGDAAYYSRFGFSPELAATLQSPFPPGDHFMAMELSPGSIEGCRGRVCYARSFGL